MEGMRITAHAKDHFGHNRTTTEDVHRIFEDLGLYLVCDASRDRDGRLAAETVCELIYRYLLERRTAVDDYNAAPSREKRLAVEALLTESVQAASEVIYVRREIEKKMIVEGLALEALLTLADCAISAHVGNTRLYLLRAGKATLLTQDHTVYQELLAGAPKGASINPVLKKSLSRSIGKAQSVAVARICIPLMAGDKLLMSSDGLTDFLPSDGKDFSEILGKLSPGDASRKLVELALSRGSTDNLTALVVGVEAGEPKQERTPAMGSPISIESSRQLSLLRKVSVFAGVGDDESALLKLQSLLTTRQVQPGTIIVEAGAPSDELFIIVSGKADAIVNGKIMGPCKPGETIGEMGFFTREKRSATVKATEPTLLLSIQRWDYDEMVSQDQRVGRVIAEAIIVSFADRVREREKTLGVEMPRSFRVDPK